MKLETYKIHKTNKTASLFPHLSEIEGIKKPVAFCIRGEYYPTNTADNLYNRVKPSPRLPKNAFDKIMSPEFPIGDIPCYVIDRGADIEIVVE